MRSFLLGSCLLLSACTNTSSSSQWREVQAESKDARFERAKTICNGRAAETQVAAGRLWIMGAAASSGTFKSCMAEQGFVQ